MRAEGPLKAGFEPFAQLYVKRVEDAGRPPVRASPARPQPSAAGAGATGRGVTAPVSEVGHVCVFSEFASPALNDFD